MIIGFLLMSFGALLIFITSTFGYLSATFILYVAWALIFLLQAIIAPGMYNSLLAMGVIFVLGLAFGFGEVLATGFSGFQKKRYTSLTPLTKYLSSSNEKRLQNTVLASGILAIVGAIMYANALGILDSLNVEDMVARVSENRENYGSGGLEVPYLSRLGFLLSYTSVILAYTYYYMYRWKWWLFIPILAVVILAMSQAGRAGLILIILQFIFAYVLRRNYMLKKDAFKTFLFMFLISSVLLPAIFLIFQLLRQKYDDVSLANILEVFQLFRTYLFSGVSGFSYYVDFILVTDRYTFGKYSFSALFAFFGIPAENGVYDQYVLLSDIGETGNIFSAFRSFIEDFSMPGAIMIFGLLGYYTGKMQELMRNGDLAKVSLLLPILSFIGFSPFLSATYFNSFLLSCFLPYFLLKWVFDKRT